RYGIAEWYYLAGRNEEAIVEAKKAVEIFPEFPGLRKFLAQALIRKGMYREALAEVNLARASTPGTPARLDLLAFCQARLGNESEARRVLAELEDWQKRGYDVDEELGYAHVGLKEYDRAVEAFERFATSGILSRSTLRNPLLMDELHDHAPFQALLRKLELKPSQLGDKTRIITPTNSPVIRLEPPGSTQANRWVHRSRTIGGSYELGLLIYGGW